MGIVLRWILSDVGSQIYDPLRFINGRSPVGVDKGDIPISARKPFLLEERLHQRMKSHALGIQLQPGAGPCLEVNPLPLYRNLERIELTDGNAELILAPHGFSIWPAKEAGSRYF